MRSYTVKLYPTWHQQLSSKNPTSKPRKAEHMSSIFATFREQKNRTFLKIWLIYIALVALIYLVLPLTFELNWLDFFDPVQNGYLPYIDFHVGYPPLGFLPFMGLALISNFDPLMYSALMRTT